MCGIAGIVDVDHRLGPQRLQEIALAMRDEMTHRGPDDAGVWVDPTGRCALAHRRLSILDLSERGRQPMVTDDGQVGLTFNGEIYNFRPLRGGLEDAGYSFRSDTDAEVLLHLFSSAEPAPLATLQGMFAFAVWNASTRRLLLARDAFGKKPLYVARGDGWLAFASELTALRRVPGFEATISKEALAEYLLLQYVHAPRAIYEDCEKLPPGSWATFDLHDGGLVERRGRHFDFRATGGHVGGPPYRPADPALLERRLDELEPVVLAAVEERLQSDVPLGAFLSGGIDSAVVVAMLTKRLGREVHTFSIGFEGTDESEHDEAREASELLGTEHHEKMLAPDAIELLPRVAAALDEPLGDSSCLPTYLLSEYTREHVTVALSGDGGDEMFGGYGRYRDTLREEADWRMRARYMFDHFRSWNPGDAYCSLRWLMFMPEDVERLAGSAAGDLARGVVSDWSARVGAPGVPLIQRMREIDVDTYLPGAVLAKVDRMSMAFSLEVRCPLLDRRVAEFATGLEAELAYREGLTKPLLRALAGRFLPREYVERGKKGFGLPGASWTRDDVLGLCEDLLLSPRSRVGGVLDPDGVAAFVAHQRQDGCFSIFQVWTVLMLESWLRAHADAPAAREVA